jgi:hypothetical protein
LNEDQAFKLLTAACKSNNARSAHQQLFLWGKARYPLINSTMDLVRLTGKNEFANGILTLEQALYSAQKQSDWQGADLLKVVTEVRNTKQAVDHKSALIGSLNPA